MEFEEKILQHERRITQTEEDVKKMRETLTALQLHINEAYVRLEKSTDSLQQQNFNQSDKMQEIISVLMESKERTANREYKLKETQQQNFWKMIFGIGGSAAIIWSIIQQVIKAIK